MYYKCIMFRTITNLKICKQIVKINKIVLAKRNKQTKESLVTKVVSFQFNCKNNPKILCTPI